MCFTQVLYFNPGTYQHFSWTNLAERTESFSLMRRIKGDLTAVFNYLRGTYREDGTKLFLKVQWQSKRQRTWTVAREILIKYEEKVVNHWTKVPREVWNRQLWIYSKFNLKRLCMPLSKLALFWAGIWTRWAPEVSLNSNYSIMLSFYDTKNRETCMAGSRE